MQVLDFYLVPFWSADLLLRELWSTNNRHSDYCHVGFSLDQQLLGSSFGTIKQDGRGFDSSYYNLPVSMSGYCHLGHLRLWSKPKVLIGSNLQSNQRTEAGSSMEKLSLAKKGLQSMSFGENATTGSTEKFIAPPLPFFHQLKRSSWRERVIRSSASCWNEVEVPRSSGARVNIVSGPALRSGIAQAGEIGKGREDD
ncbi:hypothetical protein DY000_02011905 [Brassica cretica]|uniref:Uncharacterized protein n=1 Tax=Brassica cretica TaxID=69181 RepID=A0ABQ7CQW4_BRACR|nr:hypothetical protein DY000_02011905 [Brassica cretica]